MQMYGVEGFVIWQKRVTIKWILMGQPEAYPLYYMHRRSVRVWH